MKEPTISMTLPGQEHYGLVFRTALGGVGIVMSLDMDRMDDLMMASDECVELLTHQPQSVQNMHMQCFKENECLLTVFSVDWSKQPQNLEPLPVDMSVAILETLMHKVEVITDDLGVKKITLCQPLKAS